MLGIDEGGRAADLLRFGNGVQRKRRLARAFRPVNFDHPAARQAADAKRDIEPEAAGRDRVDLDLLAAAELHRRALAERAVDLRERRFECLLTIHAPADSNPLPMTLSCAAMLPYPLVNRASERRPDISHAYMLCSIENKRRTCRLIRADRLSQRFVASPLEVRP